MTTGIGHSMVALKCITVRDVTVAKSHRDELRSGCAAL